MIFASAQKSRLSHWSPLSTAVSRVSLESLLSPPKRVQSVHRVHVATALQITAMSHCCSVHIPVIHIQRNSVFMASLSCTACVHCSIFLCAVRFMFLHPVSGRVEVVHIGGSWGMQQSRPGLLQLPTLSETRSRTSSIWKREFSPSCSRSSLAL